MGCRGKSRRYVALGTFSAGIPAKHAMPLYKLKHFGSDVKLGRFETRAGSLYSLS